MSRLNALRSPARATLDGHERSVSLFPHPTLNNRAGARRRDQPARNGPGNRSLRDSRGLRHEGCWPGRFRLVGGTELSFTPVDETIKPALRLCLEYRTQGFKVTGLETMKAVTSFVSPAGPGPSGDKLRRCRGVGPSSTSLPNPRRELNDTRYCCLAI